MTLKQTLEEAYTILNVRAEDVDAQPSIHPFLKRIGTRGKCLALLGLSEDPDARRLIEASRLLPATAQAKVPIEAYCQAAGVPTRKALAMIVEQAFATSQLDGALEAALAHPKIVATSIKHALEEPEIVTDKAGNVTVIPAPSGKFDRKLMLQHAGFLPMSKGQTIIYGNQSVDARTQLAKVTLVPSIEEAAKKMAERLEGAQRLPQLPPPQIVEESDIIEGECEDIGDEDASE